MVPVGGHPDDPLLGADQRVVGFHGLGVAAVDAGPLPGQQVVADGFAHQRVAEPVAVPVGRREQDVGSDGGPQGLDQLVLGESGDGPQQWVLDGGASLGDEAHHALGGVGQHLDPHEQQVAQGFGEPGVAAARPAGDELLDEEGVAVGAFEDGVDEALVGLGGEDPGELAAYLRPVEAGQLDPLDGTEAVQFGEEGPQRVAAVDVVRTVGGDDDETPAVQGAEEVGEEVPGGGVGPVQVLQDEHDGAVRGEPLQHPGRQLEQPGGALLVVRAAGVSPSSGRIRASSSCWPHGRGGQLVGEPHGADCAGRSRRGRRAAPPPRSRRSLRRPPRPLGGRPCRGTPR